MKNAPVDFRLMEESDKNFIYSAWLKSYRNSPTVSQMSNDVYFDNHKYIIEAILENKNTVVTIICNPEDASHLYGFAVIEEIEGEFVIHYVYVKYSFRGCSLARRLLTGILPEIGKNITKATHANRNWEALKNKFKLDFNPYLLF